MRSSDLGEGGRGGIMYGQVSSWFPHAAAHKKSQGRS